MLTNAQAKEESKGGDTKTPPVGCKIPEVNSLDLDTPDLTLRTKILKGENHDKRIA